MYKDIITKHKPGTLYLHTAPLHYALKENGAFSLNEELLLQKGDVTMLLAVQMLSGIENEGRSYRVRTTHLTNTGLVVYRWWKNAKYILHDWRTGQLTPVARILKP